MTSAAAKPAFFTREPYFYKTIGRLMSVIVLQNLVAYSVNMADNLMLGAYSQEALSGAATVNQIQFVLQQIVMAIGDSVVVLGSQYWGRRQTGPIRQLALYALLLCLVPGFGVFLWTSLAPASVLSLFTSNASYIAEGCAYLSLMRFTYPIYVLSTVLMAALRTVETVGLSLHISLVSLVVNVGINYALIFGNFGCPEMGIRGAAVGTLVSRLLELVIVMLYLLFQDKKLRLFGSGRIPFSAPLFRDYFRVLLPSFLSNLLWSLATPIQTGVLGRLSDDAIAANSVSTTIFQYLKIVAMGEASASSVLIGKTVGETSSDERLKSYTRTLQALYLLIGAVLGAALYFLRVPFLRLYDLSPAALETADGMLVVLSVVMVGMAYQMPVCVGIIKGGGDAAYMMYLNLISTWLIVMPLTFLGAFVWKLPAVWVVAILNSDQIFKCFPAAIRVNRYRWIKRLAK